MRLALVARCPSPTNAALAAVASDGVAWELLTPDAALDELRSGDAVLGRLDVLPTLDGVEDGLWALGALAARGIVVLNDAAALLATHDKLLSARLLRRSHIPHPRTLHVRPGRPFPAMRPPVVVKPRYGSWGQDVVRCDDEGSLSATLEELRDHPWYRRQGVLVQELVPPQGYDLRVVVAGERAVGAAFRVAAPGEWRTNVALGGVRRPVDHLPQEACALAVVAARAAGASLVGVDLLPDGHGHWTVLEVNGAVEFTHEYSLGADVFEEASSELVRAVRHVHEGSPPVETVAA